jgi:hypothetical protein
MDIMSPTQPVVPKQVLGKNSPKNGDSKKKRFVTHLTPSKVGAKHQVSAAGGRGSWLVEESSLVDEGSLFYQAQLSPPSKNQGTQPASQASSPVASKENAMASVYVVCIFCFCFQDSRCYWYFDST